MTGRGTPYGMTFKSTNMLITSISQSQLSTFRLFLSFVFVGACQTLQHLRVR